MGRQESKQAYQQLTASVIRSLSRHDPSGSIAGGATAAEYALDAERIIKALRSAAGHTDVVEVLHEVLDEAEGHHALAAEIWSHWTTFLTVERERRHAKGAD